MGEVDYGYSDADMLLRATIDHIVPKKQGGNSQSENKLWACYECNNLKGSRTPFEFYQFMKSYPHPLALTIIANARKLYAYYKENKHLLFKPVPYGLTPGEAYALAHALMNTRQTLQEVGTELFGNTFNQYLSFNNLTRGCFSDIVECCDNCGWWDRATFFDVRENELWCHFCRG